MADHSFNDQGKRPAAAAAAAAVAVRSQGLPRPGVPPPGAVRSHLESQVWGHYVSGVIYSHFSSKRGWAHAWSLYVYGKIAIKQRVCYSYGYSQSQVWPISALSLLLRFLESCVFNGSDAHIFVYCNACADNHNCASLDMPDL
eukprot:1148574-Pelagomonas_calceolata.AAC.2